MNYLPLLLFFICAANLSCKKKSDDKPVEVTVLDFSMPPTKIPVASTIEETSGIAESRANVGYFWIHEDSGNPAELTLLSKASGEKLKSMSIQGAANRDWEEMCLTGSDIFIADIGDNNLAYANYKIYTFPEPDVSVNVVKGISTILFKYEDGKHNSEAFLVDPKTKDIFIITKNDAESGIYKLSYPYSFTSLNTATPVSKLPYTGVVGAALSPNGSEIIIKTYAGLQLYSRLAGKSIPEALATTGRALPYILEPQGEAVTFANNNTGFYTLSEKGFSASVNLYFYKRR